MSRTAVSCSILALALSSAPLAAQTQAAPPQRTITTNPTNTAAPKPAPPPSPPPVSRTPAEPGGAAGALDSLNNSLQDLNAIRDGNLNRVQKDGCPPEISSRLADLRGRVRQLEAELSGETPAPRVAPAPDKPGADPQALASDWFKQPAQNPRDAPPMAAPSKRNAPAGDVREAKLLAEVMPDAPAPAAKPAKTEAPRKEVEDEIARLNGEIARLQGACTPLKK
jgi:hypothetical protein